MGVGIGTRWWQGKEEDGGRERLIKAKERKCGCKRLGRNARNPEAPYLYPDERPTDESTDEASNVSAFNALT
jgi:hypothetical protein